ncbi:hypothetical protein SAMN05444166_8424 [Singulisphaera sp. GP187]|nr:hypothetical protein SAMN05444166_8424 [Singulisphaera sp. GP187]
MALPIMTRPLFERTCSAPRAFLVTRSTGRSVATAPNRLNDCVRPDAERGDSRA